MDDNELMAKAKQLVVEFADWASWRALATVVPIDTLPPVQPPDEEEDLTELVHSIQYEGILWR